jgi:hypothetical protein
MPCLCATQLYPLLIGETHFCPTCASPCTNWMSLRLFSFPVLLESTDRDIILQMIRVSSYSLLKLLRKPINSSGHYMEKNNRKNGD